MSIKSEWDLLDKIRDKVLSSGIPVPRDLIEGIGDDCSVFDLDDKRFGLITTDIAVEGRHFSPLYSTSHQVGFRAITANLSDIAAMGGRPRFAFITLGLPKNTDENYVMGLYDGMIRACRKTGTVISGGDLSISDQVIISIAVYGDVSKKRLVRRKGAQPGDIICLTGNTGDSLAGLEILKKDPEKSALERKKFSSLVDRHLEPSCRAEITGLLVDTMEPTAMIDISDGLISDLGHICRSSNTGFELDADALPKSQELADYCSEYDKNPLDYVLYSGEEYELLFTVKSHPPSISNISDIKVTPIGEITDNGYFIHTRGRKTPIEIRGFDHFHVT